MIVIQNCFQFLTGQLNFFFFFKSINSKVGNFQGEKKVYSEIVAKSVIINKTGTKS